MFNSKNAPGQTFEIRSIMRADGKVSRECTEVLVIRPLPVTVVSPKGEVRQ